MKSSRLTLALAVSFGLANSVASSAVAQSCDCDSLGSHKPSCVSCDNEGLLDALGSATSRFESKLSKRLAEFAAVVTSSQCDSGCDSACDSISGQHCANCAKSHSNIQAPIEHSLPTPNSNAQIQQHAPMHPPHASAHPHATPKASPTPHRPVRPNVPNQIPVPPPLNAPQPHDSNVDPFRDDSVRSGQPLKLKSIPVGYVRPANSEDTSAPSPLENYSGALNPLSKRPARSSISDNVQSTDSPDYQLSSGSSRRKQLAAALLSDEAVARPEPSPSSQVVRASVALPVRPNSTRTKVSNAAALVPTESDPVNPLRSR